MFLKSSAAVSAPLCIFEGTPWINRWDSQRHLQALVHQKGDYFNNTEWAAKQSYRYPTPLLELASSLQEMQLTVLTPALGKRLD